MNKFKPLPLYPFLFGLYVLADLFSRNYGEIRLFDLWRAGWISMAGIGAVFLAAWAATRHLHRAGWISFGVAAFLFWGGHLERVMRTWLQPEHPERLADWTLVGWIILVAALVAAFAWKVKDWHSLTRYLNLVSLLLLALPALRLATAVDADFSRMVESALQPAEAREMVNPAPALESDISPPADGKPLPDIYLIVLDGYARQDVLQRMYDLDNQPFIDWLQERGFIVPPESRTNYIQTLLSLTALLNLDYLPHDRIPADDGGYYSLLGDWLQTSRVLSTLKAQGYQIVDVVGGYRYTVLQSADLTYRAFYRLNDYERLLFSTTSLYRLNEWFNLGFVPAHSYETHRRRVRFDFETLESLASPPGPKFVFAHIVSPHPPFVFDARGEPLESSLPFGWEDGSHFPGTLQEYQQGYRGQVEYVNAQLQEVVDALLRRSQQPPVILLLSDHGPGSHLDWESMEKTCLWERGSNFVALYLPQGAPSQIYASISTVNLFRVVLNALFGSRLGMLEDRTYYTPWGQHNLMLEITDRLQPEEKCFTP